MALRFVDSDIFKDDFVRSLKGPYKLFWFYLFCDCNSSGFWSGDFDAATLYCGKIDQDKAEEIFSGKFIKTEDSNKWFLPGFIKLQYKGKLCQENKAHTKIIDLLLLNDLIEFDKVEDSKTYFRLKKRCQGGSKALPRGSKVEVKEEDKVKAKVGATIFSKYSETFISEQWQKWKDYKKKKHKFTFHDLETEQKATEQLFTLSGPDEKLAAKIIDQSMVAGWKGLFALKLAETGTQKPKEDDSMRNEFYGGDRLKW